MLRTGKWSRGLGGSGGSGREAYFDLHITAWSFWAQDRFTSLDRLDSLILGPGEGGHTDMSILYTHTYIYVAGAARVAAQLVPSHCERHGGFCYC